MKQTKVTYPIERGTIVKLHTTGMVETDKGFRMAKNALTVVGAKVFQEQNGKITVEKKRELQTGVTQKLFDEAVESGIDADRAEKMSKPVLESHVGAHKALNALKDKAIGMGATKEDVEIMTKDELASFISNKG